MGTVVLIRPAQTFYERINVKQQPDFEELRDAVEDAIRALPEDIEDSEAPALGLDELEKLAYLKDKGIITAKEFEAKKKQILGL